MKIKMRKAVGNNGKSSNKVVISAFNICLSLLLGFVIYKGTEGKSLDLPTAPIISLSLENHHFAELSRNDQIQVNCLADAIYWEARGESLKGQLGVGYVVLNRMANRKHWPSTACGVVYQKKSLGNNRYHCQFSWVCEHGGKARRNESQYANAVKVARAVIDDLYPNPIGESTFFHSQLELSYKFAAYEPTVALGGHYFYRL